MFDRVLVANRGEIAVRVMRTLRRLGIGCVAVYSDADAAARHVLEADEAIRIGPAPARESYLDVERVMAAVAASGAQALHPGYGFLSERPELAEACAAAGVTFIGPPPSAIRAMGDKVPAKQLVARAGVPVVPGVDVLGLTDEQLYAAALQVGLPVLLKPSAGGGGKGMHLVERESDLAAAVARARREAAAAFGDDDVFVERFVTRPRHVEIQVLADAHGNVVHLGERECSLQRRHQKIVEEAPSPLLDAATRAAMGRTAVAAAAACGYVNAGTVEFIVSGDDPTAYFFMEMNTRLQVEHPVTEMLYGIDLVEWQVRVAAGEPLGFTQDDLVPRGHAVEARVYAEDPTVGFLPSGGRLLEVREPAGPGVRVDSGVRRGSVVASDYDPMLAKVIAHGPDRAEAYRRLGAALGDAAFVGVTTNTGFLRRLVGHREVLAGRLDTGLVERELGVLAAEPDPGPALVAAAWRLRGPRRAGRGDTGRGDPWTELRGWRHGRRQPTVVVFECRGALHEVTLVAGSGPGSGPGSTVWTAAVDGGPEWPVSVHGGRGRGSGMAADGGPSGDVELRWGGRRHRFTIRAGGTTIWVVGGGDAWALHALERLPRGSADSTAGSADTVVRSPMPGSVIAVLVAEGDTVEAGQAVAAVEAMKMEHTLTARVAGTVVAVPVRVGDQVAIGDAVMVVEPAHAAASGPPA